ncbi:hypothetical protein P4561_17710 [Priestia flexa]|uniref:hypothetical protein n=1 Tax=Priestia flexa TaxID=86664 RepID=UPI002E20F12F|nr:hypothetical protein [Priestia flexa]
MQESINKSGIFSTALGFIAGAGTFTVFDVLLARKGGHNPKRSTSQCKQSSGLDYFSYQLL